MLAGDIGVSCRVGMLGTPVRAQARGTRAGSTAKLSCVAKAFVDESFEWGAVALVSFARAWVDALAMFIARARVGALATFFADCGVR